MSTGDQGAKCRRDIAENYNRLSRVHERYRQTDGRATAYYSEREFTFANNGSPYAIGPLSCLSVLSSVTRVYCGQTVRRIKMKLGMEIGLGPGHIVLDGDPATPNGNGHNSLPLFGPCLLWPNGRPSQLLLSSFIHCTYVGSCNKDADELQTFLIPSLTDVQVSRVP